MKSISNKKLNKLAIEFCSAKVEQALKGDFLVDIDDSEVEWDPTFLRFIHEANLGVWKKLGKFEFIVDGDENPIGFVNPLIEKGCEHKKISGKKLLGIIYANPIFTGKRVELVKHVTENNGAMVCDVHVGSDDGKKLRYQVKINPVSEEIISAKPLGELENE